MHLWDNIAEAAVPEVPQRKRKGLVWLWLLPLFLVTGIGWAYFDHISAPKQATELDYFPIQTLPSASTESTQTTSLSSKPPMAVVNSTADATLLAIDTRESVNKVAATRTSSAQKGAEKVSIPQAAPPVGSITKEQTPANVDITTAKTAQVEKAVPIAAIPADLSDTEDTKDTALKELVTGEALADAEEALPIWMLEPLSGPLLLVDNPIGDEVLTFSLSEAKSWLTTVDLMASMDFVMRQLEAKDPAYADYARVRDNTETFRHGVSVGMRLSTISEGGFAVRSGLNYSAINEQLNFKIKEEERLKITTRYAPDGSVIGADTSIQVVGTYRIVNNRYTELDIPLLVGYEYVGEKVSFSFNGGIFINMLSAQKGEFVSPNSEEPVSFSSSDPNSYRAFKNRVGLGFYGSMGVYLQVKDNLQVLLEPYAKWRPGSYTVDGYFLDQRFLTTGLFVGVRKRII